MFDDLLTDIRYAFRWLRRSPGFTLVAVASFAIGIGFNTALFSVVDALLFRPLPVRDPARLVDVYSTSDHDRYATTSYPDYLDLRAQNRVFDDLIGYSPMFAALNDGDHSRLVSGEVVTGNYFQMLGVSAQIGRTLMPSDDRADAARAVMISDAYWRRELAADPAVVGRHVRLRGLPYTIVGVAPRTFTGMMPILSAQMWVPTSQVEEINVAGIQSSVPSPTGNTRLEQRGNRWMFVKGRLKPGVGTAQAYANLDLVMRGLAATNPQTNKDVKVSVLRTSDVHVHPDANQILVVVSSGLMLVMGLVLLVGCANVASMLLARAAARHREVAIRLAIGAGRARLVRQLLTESLMLAGLGAAAGVLLGWTLLRAFAGVHVPLPIPIELQLPLDGRVLAFTVALSLLAGVVAGLAPAWRSSRWNVVGDLRGDRTGARAGGRRWTLRDGLVAGQIAVTVVLLVCAGLLAQSLFAAQQASLGLRTRGLAILGMDLEMARYDTARSRAFLRQALDRARAIPGVEYADIASRLPFSVDFSTMTFFIPGRDEPGGKGTPIDTADVGPDYFKLFDIPMVAGRPFAESDTRDKRLVAVINETMARRFWPGTSPVGRVIRTRAAEVEIVGVCADYKANSVGEAAAPYIHLAYTQRGTSYGSLVVRTRGNADSLLAQLRRELLTLEPNVVFVVSQTMTQQVATTLFPVEAGAWIVGLVAAVAMLLAGVGLYGVISYAVARRSREIGIRMALGARPRAVLGLVVRQGLTIAIAGLALGSLAAIAAGRLLASALYGISTLEPLPWLAATAIVLLVSALANLVPARRAAAVDPTTALRAE